MQRSGRSLASHWMPVGSGGGRLKSAAHVEGDCRSAAAWELVREEDEERRTGAEGGSSSAAFRLGESRLWGKSGQQGTG